MDERKVLSPAGFKLS